jgi:hypothetical protein
MPNDINLPRILQPRPIRKVASADQLRRTVDVRAILTATNIGSTDLEDDFLVLDRDQLQQVQLFRDNIGACQTDDEKYDLCVNTRDDLLAQPTGLELLVAAYRHIMLVECAGYEKWKARAAKSKRRTKRQQDAEDDAALWERFVGVVQSGSTIKVQCLRALKTVSRFWDERHEQK